MKCPVCNTELIMTGVDYMCPKCSVDKGNPKRIAHFFRTLGAETITDKTVEKLGVGSIEDMYLLNEEDIMDIEGFGAAKASKLFDEILKTLTTTPERLLAAFGIPLIGIENAKVVLSKTKCFEDIFFMEDGETGFAQKTEEVFLENIRDYEELWHFLLTKNILFKSTSSNGLKGKTFAITGTLPEKRDTVIRLIEDNGGTFNKSVSSKTQYLLVGDNKNLTVKMKEAERRGTKIIMYEDLLEMIK